MSRDSVAVLKAMRAEMAEEVRQGLRTGIPEPKKRLGLTALDAAIAVLTRETAPQASAGDGAFADWLAHEMPAGTIIGDPYWWAPRILRTARRLATTDSAIQSQQGATGGAVDDEMVKRVATTYECLREGAVAFRPNETCLAYMRTALEDAFAHPQAAGSAPGEALHPAHTVEAAKRAFNIDSAGSVASPANPAWEIGERVEWQDSVGKWCAATISAARPCDKTRGGTSYSADLDSGERVVGFSPYRFRKPTRATAAGSAPVGVDADTARLDALRDNSWDLCCFDMCGGEDIGWTVFEHHQADPIKREVSIVFKDDPRAAIDAALEKERAE